VRWQHRLRAPRTVKADGVHLFVDVLDQQQPDAVMADEAHAERAPLAVVDQDLVARSVEAFAACEYLMDRIKEDVPIWKKEHWADGPAHWVGDDSDNDAD
jgi:hypothetical protein